MPSKGQRIPSMIFLSEGATSMTSMASVAEELGMESPTPRRFSRLDLDSLLAKTAPRLPKRKSSKGMGFRKNSSFLGRSSNSSGSNANARFELGTPKGKSNKKSLFDKFSSIAPMLSPTPSESSRKSVSMRSSSLRSSRTTDTPLTLPRRKPSHQKFTLSSP